jgi:hypothetical protein
MMEETLLILGCPFISLAGSLADSLAALQAIQAINRFHKLTKARLEKPTGSML